MADSLLPTKQNSKQIGDVSELAVMFALQRHGITICEPRGDKERYDLVIHVPSPTHSHGFFFTVQCKTGRLRNGYIEFHCYSIGSRSNIKKGYHGQVHFFGVYCPELNTTYMIPVERCGGTTKTLRIEPPKNNQVSGIDWAKDYEIC